MEKGNYRLVVMGGSFNPPTVAHHVLMQEAIDALDADKGIFVPVSDAYLRRKMRRSHPPMVLSPEMRVMMLESMCTDSCMTVCRKEIGTIEPRTMATLMELQAQYPTAEIYFLLGSDKLNLLEHLADKSGFLDKYKVVLYSRDKIGINGMLGDSDILSNYRGRIVILPQPEGTYNISSSIVRRRFLDEEPCSDMLYPGVWKLLKTFNPGDFPDIIDKFSGEYSFLSNRFTCQFTWQGLSYNNAESAFQSSKLINPEDRNFFCRCSADKAKARGNRIDPPEGWHDNRLEIMTSVLTAKFTQNPGLMEKLKATGDAFLIDGNSKQETFWGLDLYSWKGDNNLGRILMTIRDQEDLYEVYG